MAKFSGIKVSKKSEQFLLARQYFEKALTTLEGQTYTDDFITNKKAEAKHYIEEITNELKSANAKDAQQKEKDEQDDLDLLFAPKKKW